MNFQLAPAERGPQRQRNHKGNASSLSSRHHKKSRTTERSYSAPTPRNLDEETVHAEKISREAARWQQDKLANERRYVESTPRRYKFRKELHDCIAKTYQAQVDQALILEREAHRCVRTLFSPGASSLAFRKTRHVVVHDFGHRFILKVDSYSCSCCNYIVTVHPFDVDCAATTPTEECETWIPLKSIQFFEDVHYRNGLAADAYCHAMAGVERQYQPEGCDLVNSLTGDKIVAGPLKASNLITAAMEFGKIDSEVGRPRKITSDPLVECLVCAYSAREKLRNGTTSVPPANVAIAADGMNAANRFASAGMATRHLKPTTSSYLANPARRILDMTNLDRNFERDEAARLAQRVEEADMSHSGVLPPCTTALSCNREISFFNRADLDHCGVVSIVCSHNIPALGCTIAMPAPEQHAYYDAAFREFLTNRPEIDAIYLDLMCRYHGRLKLLLQDLTEAGILPPEVTNIKLLLPWMHAFDHDLTCQLKFSGLYQEGTGRRVGEQTESWWAIIKAWCKRARYMSPRQWWDGLNRMYLLLTRQKQQGFPLMLEKKLDRNKKKKESCRKELEALKREAAQNGVHDCDAALQVLTQLEGENATSLSDAAKYVEARLQMDSHNGLLVHKAAFPLHLPGNAGIHLHKRATDAAEKRRLEKYLDAATVKLGILPGNHWQASSPEFAAGLAELRTNVIVRYQGSVELMVFKRKQILLEKARNDSGKNAKKIEKRLQAARAHIQQVLAVVATWTVYGTDALPTMVSDAHLKEVLDGKFPWRQISAGSNERIVQLDAVLTEISDVESLEASAGPATAELPAAPDEAAAAATSEIEVNPPAAPVDRAFLQGKLAIYHKERQRMQCILDDALKRFQKSHPFLRSSSLAGGMS
ncbi:hypothetical protein NADE_001807 [Nannochloris sp. 'desiccata']|nr:hypothetical protein KSW81_001341 [Chlorella desiccata (nom. nud.)]KAH7617005.1 hypothetical protein NADE_001807 [Chlorella desiccata (nom. nud.)]